MRKTIGFILKEFTKAVRILSALALMIGFPCPIISVTYFENGHSVLFAPLAILSAFIGTALIFGLKGFKVHPKWIGNINDGTEPKINQNWAVFFITLIFNLLGANLC